MSEVSVVSFALSNFVKDSFRTLYAKQLHKGILEARQSSALEPVQDNVDCLWKGVDISTTLDNLMEAPNCIAGPVIWVTYTLPEEKPRKHSQRTQKGKYTRS